MRNTIGVMGGVLALLSASLVGCGSDGNGADGNGGGKAGSSGAAGSNATAAGSGGSAGSASTSGGQPPVTPPGSTPEAMPLISQDVPAFASSNAPNASPESAQDGKPNTTWISGPMPASLSYDLSGVPADERDQVLIAWYAGAALDFLNPAADASKRMPIDYTLEINQAAGGGEPPTDGWETIQTVVGNDRNSRQLLVALDGANWVRMNVSKSSDPSAVGIDLDIHSAPNGATDSWLFMGDSITFMSTSYLFSDLPARVHEQAPDRWPAVIPAAIGGTNTTTALAALDNTMQDFPGRFVVLAYGTNDHPAEYHMEELVERVLAAGKAPVVPHMPWSTDARIQTEGPEMNLIIDGLYEKYPEILRGPDFWAIMTDRTDLIPVGDVHPNDAGREEFRKQWALAMTR